MNPIRVVQLEIDPKDLHIWQSIPGYEDFDPTTEVILMVKAVYGLKDAPRAWRLKLHRTLIAYLALRLRDLFADPQLYVGYRSNQLAMLLSTHVDGLKGGAKRQYVIDLHKYLSKHFGDCKIQFETFVHVGIEHVQSSSGIYTHQETYKKQLKDMDRNIYANLDA